MVEGTGSVRISRRELREPHDKEQKSKRAKEQRVEFVKLSKGDPGVPRGAQYKLSRWPIYLYFYISDHYFPIVPLPDTGHRWKGRARCRCRCANRANAHCMDTEW